MMGEHGLNLLCHQGEIRENRATTARARDEEAAILEQERTARRELDVI